MTSGTTGEAFGERGGEIGAGSALGVAVLAGVLCLATGALAVMSVLPQRHALAAAADAAALAAADSASGRLPGYPCDLAREAAALSGAGLEACSIDGVEARVTVSRVILGIDVTVSARAGPPPGGGAGGGVS